MNTQTIGPGDRFGRLTVVSEVGIAPDGAGVKRRSYLCRCMCGNEVVKSGTALKCGTVKSCGCFRRDRAGKLNFKHGGFGTRLYMTWVDMRRRCYGIRRRYEKSYTRKHIKVCREWDRSWTAFRDWAKANGYRDDLVIDRIDNSKGYYPENCRWVTVRENTNNRDVTVWVQTPKGKMCFTDALLRFGKACDRTVRARIRHGWDAWTAIVTPPIQNKRK